jgi:hypothetical protein
LDLLEGESFPGSTRNGMGEKIVECLETEKRMEQSGVAEIGLRCPYLTLADILVPRLELPHHERSRQEIEISPHGLVRQAHRTGQLGRVPRLSLIVRQHGPEAARGSRDSKEERAAISSPGSNRPLMSRLHEPGGNRSCV